MASKVEIYHVQCGGELPRDLQLNVLLLALPDSVQLDFLLSEGSLKASFQPEAVVQGQERTRDGTVDVMKFKGRIGFGLGSIMRKATFIVPRDQKYGMHFLVSDPVRARSSPRR